MKVLLVDADSHNNFPNLALMKLSAWHKQQGDHIDLIKGIPTTQPLIPYDKTYISCIFYQNKREVYDYAKQLDNVIIGGSGWNYQTELIREIEHIKPDYELYKTDYSMGFTSRGCIRKCHWCIVPRKEGYISDHAFISEFHHSKHKKVILLDNNFLASPRWSENLDYIIDNKLKVNFNQGLDIRLVDEQKALYLAKTKYYNWTFKTRGLHFAFDSIEIEPTILKKTKQLFDAGIKPRHLMFYILVGFNTSIEDDLRRIEVVKELGSIPYIMRYNQIKNQYLTKIARWVNRRYYQFMSYKDYDHSK